MKKINFYFLISLLALTVTFTSCDKDDNDDIVTTPTGGEALYDGTTYALDNGYIINYGEAETNGDAFEFVVYLATDGITYDATEEVFEGDGSLLLLGLMTDSEEKLVSGTYNFSSEELPFTFVYAHFDPDYADEEIDDTYIDGGTVEVNVETEDNIVITYSLTDNTGKTITGSYSGSIKEIF